jgi:Recombinase zinc beta ribbon domain
MTTARPVGGPRSACTPSSRTRPTQLHLPTARGTIVYGRVKVGYYLSTPGLHVGEGRHIPLVSREVFEGVRERLRQARCRFSLGGGPHRTYWIAGLLCCAQCGGRMIPWAVTKAGEHGRLRCSNRYAGRVPCTADGYRLDLAEDALLAQVRRLRGSPWTLEKELLLAGQDGATAATLDRALAEARETLTRANRRFMVEIREPTAEDRAAFEAVRCEMGARIRELE